MVGKLAILKAPSLIANLLIIIYYHFCIKTRSLCMSSETAATLQRRAVALTGQRPVLCPRQRAHGQRARGQRARSGLVWGQQANQPPRQPQTGTGTDQRPTPPTCSSGLGIGATDPNPANGQPCCNLRRQTNRPTGTRPTNRPPVGMRGNRNRNRPTANTFAANPTNPANLRRATDQPTAQQEQTNGQPCCTYIYI